MADDLRMKAKIELDFVDKNGNKVLATAKQVDKAVSKIGSDAAASQRGADAVTKQLTSSLKTMYGVSQKVASSMSRDFKTSLIQSMVAGESLSTAMAMAAVNLKKTADEAHYSERAFTSIANLLPTLMATFSKASGANALLKAKYDAKVLKEELSATVPVAQTATNQLQRMASSATKLAKATRNTSQAEKQLRDALKQIVSTLESVDSRMAGLTARTLAVGNAMRGLRSSISRVWTGFYRVSAAVRRLVHIGKEWLDMSTAFAETNHLLMTTLIHSTGTLTATKVAMEDVTEETKDLVVQLTDASDNVLGFGLQFENADIAGIVRDATSELQRFTYAMMLDPTSIRQVYSAFLGMADAAGIMGERAVTMSQQMMQLAVNLSSLWDIDIEDAATKLRSALAGNTRAARALGLDMGRSAANAWLLANGIDVEYNSLSLADRMTVQYALAMEGAAAAHDDLAKSALQPANMLRILGEQAKKTARAFGNALFPVFTAFVPLIIVMVEALGKLANALSAFFSRKLGSLYDDAKEQWVSYADNVRFTARQVSDEMLDMEDDVDGVAASTGRAADAAKDFKKQLLGFDEINNLTEKETSAGGVGGIGGLGDSVIPQSILDNIKALADGFGNVRIQIEAAAEKIKKLIGGPLIEMSRLFRSFPEEMRPTFKGLIIGLGEATLQTINLLDHLGKIPEKLKPLQKIALKSPGTSTKNAFELATTPVDRRMSRIESARTGLIEADRMAARELPLEYSRVQSKVSPGLTIGEKGGLVGSKALQGPTRGVGAVTKEITAAEETLTRATGGFGKFALAISEVDGPLKTLFSGLGKVFGRLNPILDIITLVVELLKNSPLLRGTLTTILGTLVTILSFLGGIIDSIFGILSPVFGILGDILAFALQPIAVGLQFVATILSLLQSLLQPLADSMRGFTEQMQTAFDMPSTIFGQLQELGGTPTFIDSVTADAADAASLHFGEMAESADTTGESMKASMKDACSGDNGILSIIGNLLSDIIMSVLQWIQTVDWADVVSRVANFIGENGGKILNVIATILGNIFNAIVNWIVGDLIPNFPTYLAKVWDIINTVLGGWPNKLLEMGRNFIVGFWNGIQEKIEWVKQKVRSAFDSVGNVVKKLFGIASPSKLMAEYGGFVTEGFEIGISSGLPTVFATVNALADGVTDIMSGGVIDVGTLADAEMTKLNASLATGVAATTNATINTQNSDLLSASQTEISLLREQNNLLGQLLEKEFGVSLDGNMLAASINKASRVQGRPLVWA